MAKRFATLSEAAMTLHVPFYRVKEAHEAGNFPTPDVAIGDKKGWEMTRMIEFGKEVGLLDETGIRSKGPRSIREPLNIKWTVQESTYIGKEGIGELLNMKPSAVYVKYHQGAFIDPHIYIGRKAGWETDAVIKYAKQMGILP